MRKMRSGGLAAIVVLFQLTAMGVLSIRTGSVDFLALIIGAGASVLFIVQYYVMTRMFSGTDGLVLVLTGALTAVGLTVIYRINPDLALKQLIFLAAGTLLMIIAAALVRKINTWERFTPLYMIAGVALLSLSLLFGKEIYGAKNWFSIAGYSFQPSELVKLLLIFTLASILRRKSGFGNLAMLWLFTGVCMVLLVLQKDLGATMLFFLSAVIMVYTATSNLLITGVAIGGGAAGSLLAYQLFPHVRVRVQIWQNPWASVDTTGYQIVQGLMAIASGGMFGLGLGQGSVRAIPVVYTDSIFAAICEEMGIIVGLCVIALYVILILRGISISRRSDNAFDMLLSFGITVLIALHAFINVGGVIKLIPLTGITLPFVSYGGSSLLTMMALIGVLEGICAKTHKEEDEYYDEDEYDEDEYIDEYYDEAPEGGGVE